MDTSLGVIFLTGLSIGGLTCLAVQGGLLASVLANQSDRQIKLSWQTFIPITIFLLAKLVVYLSLGALLGLFGGAFSLSSSLQGWLQLLAALYMLAIAFNLLNIHPIFRYAVIQPPRFLTQLVKNQSKNTSWFAPAIMGLFTVFLPCGTTLAMEALAISSGNAVLGASIMGVFVLGTFPVFYGLGLLTSLLNGALQAHFYKVAAVGIIYLALVTINGSLTNWGYPIELNFGSQEVAISETAKQVGDYQSVEIRIEDYGYSPSQIQVKVGQPVRLVLISENAYSCALAFRIPSLGISKNLKPTDRQVIEFTPDTPGRINFSCSMGMYRGVIEVVP